MSAPAENTPKKKGGAGWISTIFGLALSAAFFMPTTIIVVIGMLPTLVMIVADPSPDRRGALAIGVLNFAGVLPFVISVWRQGHTMDVAIRILKDPTSWLVMLGAAAVATVIYIYVPKSVAMFSAMRAQTEIASRRALQRKLVDRWGEHVTSSKSISELTGE